MTSYAGGPFQRIQLQITDLTSEQLAVLTSDPPVFVPAPGPGHALAVLAAYSLVNPGTIPFLSTAPNLTYPGITQNLLSGTLLNNNGLSGPWTQRTANSTEFDPFPGENQPLVGLSFGDDPSGAILANTLGSSGGATYAPGDTFNISSFTNSVGVVDTVDGGGAVLTYHLTNNGFGGVPGVDLATNVLTGGGDGNLVITVTTITPANGTARVWVYYMVLELP